MSNGFPPQPVYPFAIDSDYSLFLVHNTTESKLTATNQPWADEVEISPVSHDKKEIWSANGFATIEGEIFYYDIVGKDINGKVNSLKRCVRNLGGKKSKFNLAGTDVRGFVMAEHHNQLVDTVLRIENFIGENLTADQSTLDWRIRNLQKLQNIQADHTCVDATLNFNILSKDPASGTVAQYKIDIVGSYNAYRLDFGDGTFTDSSLSGKHIYAPNTSIDPVVTISNEKCTTVQSPPERLNPTEPADVPSITDFLIPIPECPDIPLLVLPEVVIPSVAINFPPLVLPCLDLSPIGSINIPSLIIVEPPINIPELIQFGGINIPSEIVIRDVSIPTEILIIAPGFNLPSLIEFGNPNIPSAITFNNPNIPSAIVFNNPNVPSAIVFNNPNIPANITFSGCNIPSIITIQPVVIPSIITIQPVVIPTSINIINNLPASINIVSNLATSINIVNNLPTSIMLVGCNFPTYISTATSILVVGFPTSIQLMPTNIQIQGMPSAISLIGFSSMINVIGFSSNISLDNFSSVIRLDSSGFSSVIKIDASGLPSAINVTGMPSSIMVTFPSTIPTISVNWNTPPVVSCIITVNCPGSGTPMAMSSFNESFKDGFTVQSEEITSNDLGIPSEIKLIAPEIPNILIQHDLPSYIDLRGLSIPTFIELGMLKPLPEEIKISHNLPDFIELRATDIPKTIFLKNLDVPDFIELRMAEDMPRSLKLELSGIPESIQLIGAPTSIQLIGNIPETIRLLMPDKPEVEMVYRGDPIKVKIELDMNKLIGENDQDGQCFRFVPCKI